MDKNLGDVFETYYLDFTVKEASLMAKRYYYAILRVSEAGEDCKFLKICEIEISYYEISI